MPQRGEPREGICDPPSIEWFV